eukprot:m.394024 g.394024  ORF g.394024 m.394024 type:complete len:227 (+) comp56369_c0_seq6:78-758(+)
MILTRAESFCFPLVTLISFLRSACSRDIFSGLRAFLPLASVIFRPFSVCVLLDLHFIHRASFSHRYWNFLLSDKVKQIRQENFQKRSERRNQRGQYLDSSTTAAPSTLNEPMPSTQPSLLSSQCSVPSTQPPTPSIQFSVPSTQPSTQEFASVAVSGFEGENANSTESAELEPGIEWLQLGLEEAFFLAHALDVLEVSDEAGVCPIPSALECILLLSFRLLSYLLT